MLHASRGCAVVRLCVRWQCSQCSAAVSSPWSEVDVAAVAAVQAVADVHRSVAARELERAGVRRGGWHGGPVAAAAGGTEGQLPPAPSQAMVQTPSPDATRAFQLHEARVSALLLQRLALICCIYEGFFR